MSKPKLILTNWTVERWDSTTEQYEVVTKNWPMYLEFHEGLPCVNPEYATPDNLDYPSDKQVADALMIHTLIEQREIEDAYHELEYILVVSAWDGSTLGRITCTSHESLYPLVKREMQEA